MDAYTWRERLAKGIRTKYNVIIPEAKDPKMKKSHPNYRRWVYELYIRPDISDVLRSKYLFVKIDKAVLRGAGTISEVCFAAYYRKNIVYMLTDGLKEKDLPGWMLGCLVKATKVKTIKEAVEYYNKRYK